MFNRFPEQILSSRYKAEIFLEIFIFLFYFISLSYVIYEYHTGRQKSISLGQFMSLMNADHSKPLKFEENAI